MLECYTNKKLSIASSFPLDQSTADKEIIIITAGWEYLTDVCQARHRQQRHACVFVTEIIKRSFYNLNKISKNTLNLVGKYWMSLNT
jgi:hypothetical protein